MVHSEDLARALATLVEDVVHDGADWAEGDWFPGSTVHPVSVDGPDGSGFYVTLSSGQRYLVLVAESLIDMPTRRIRRGLEDGQQ